MNFVAFVTAVVLGLMLLFVYDLGAQDEARRKAAAAQVSAFRCRPPLKDGHFTVITVRWQDDELVGDCDYLINQISGRKGG